MTLHNTTAALAAILALGSFSANASSYAATTTLDLTFNMAQAITIILDSDDMVFSNLVPGDTIDATQIIAITADTSYGDGMPREITCNIGSAGEGSDYITDLLGESSISIAEVTLSLATCVHGDNILSVTSTEISSLNVLSDTTYTIDDITIVVSYTSELVTTFS